MFMRTIISRPKNTDEHHFLRLAYRNNIHRNPKRNILIAVQSKWRFYR